MPQIRHRPFYPLLAKDGQTDKGGKDSNGEGCQKHYLKYGKQSLTGGLMVVWCTHSICYGFHHIPMAEGRNEVFSAIYTHWEKAPEIVIYDFACNLEPYCMTREADFFADTTFLIDKFHSAGHTKCGRASFVNTYVAANPRLMDINSSAAECGNGGVHGIRKSVSYMTQDNAIVYTKVYFSYWNRFKSREVSCLR
ncbi:hypothetical protein GALMADRAFT_225673 [Galerina marginata CBS 339.88]|uniref:CxC6 like cysteine cluster associated with KDZ domain-containing protein n=1 Tax=Galerina marginata (strain CBS 339.88) TaxID=685588 RepID=A0A067TCQ4_GALM3|nr:hypothetical protein GALMADRAFT_225673 [Galerina marginata CBS 339.88]